METRNHLYLTNRLSGQVNHSAGLHIAVAFGSIFPDINVLTYLRGNHTFENSYPKVRATLRRLLEKPQWGLLDVWRFGQIIHYAGDFFTHSHSPDYTGGLVAHEYYERTLHAQMRDYLASGAGAQKSEALTDADAICEYLETRYQTYCAMPQSMEWDCICITSVTDRMVKTFWALANERCGRLASWRAAALPSEPEMVPSPIPVPVLKRGQSAG